MIVRFPVTKLDHSIPDKGVHVARRGSGNVVARCLMVLGKTDSGPELEAVENAEQKDIDRAKKTKGWLEESFRFLFNHVDTEIISNQIDLLRESGSMPVEFLKDHDCLMGFQCSTNAILQCDINAADEIGDEHTRGVEVLYALGLLHGSSSIKLFYEKSLIKKRGGINPALSGSDEEAALSHTIAFWEILEEGDRENVIQVLSLPQIDTGNVFLRFIQGSAYKPEQEKRRLIAWLRGRVQIDLPYNDTDVIKALQEETDLAALRLRIYNAINDTYVQSVDTENARRIADECMDKDMRIVAGRFSRALYLDAMLMANASVIDTGYLREYISSLESLVNSLSLEFDDPSLARRMPGSFSRIGGEVQMVANLAAEEQVSQAQIEGTLSRLKKALREFETYCLETLDSEYRIESSFPTKVGDPVGADTQHYISRLTQYRNEIRSKVEQIFQEISRVEIGCFSAPKKEPVFLIFLQRIHPLDAINMGTLNQLVDPFFGEDEEVHALMRGCGHIMYTTANLRGWLRKCDDWIEALPAYASYEIVPQKEGAASYTVTTQVWRAILEEMYKQHAEDWAVNIEEVMSLEHIALAREILLNEKNLGDESTEIPLNPPLEKGETGESLEKGETGESLEKGENGNLFSENCLADETAELGALIEKAYLDMCDQVARRVEAQGVTRIEALKQLLTGGGILPVPADRGRVIQESNLTRRVEELRELTQTFLRKNFDQKTRRYKSSFPSRPRDLPSVHVLTTLGPGETENVENWLQESMALFNVSRAYNLESTSVQKRISDYRKRIYHLGEKILGELDLEGDLYNLMQTEGLSDREAGILRLIDSYPEVASKVAELAVLIEYEEKQSRRFINPEYAEEPSFVIEYVSSHPELNDALSSEDEIEKQNTRISLARGALVRSLGLGEDVRNFMRDHLPERLGVITARREVIIEKGLSKELENPKFRYESHGPFKKYNLLYTPSRVDLGIDEVESVKNVPKWIGGRDRQAANAGKALYSLYNLAGPTAMPAIKFAEFLKVGENFFSRGGVFYLSLAAGANLDALHTGDFEFFRDQWNMRGDRIVLPTGETYGGFCVPKEFTLLYSVILSALDPKTSLETLKAFGVPEEMHEPVLDDLRKILKARSDFDSALDWEAYAHSMLDAKYSKLSAAIRFPLLATTMESKGLIAGEDQEDVATGYRLAGWINKKAHGLEEINRSGPFRKVHLIYRLVGEARKKNPDVAQDTKLAGVMGAPYKEGGRKDGKDVPITDVRFGAGARKLEIYAGTAEKNLLKHIDPEGQELLKDMFRSFQPPADIRIVGTCTASDILNHVPRSGLEEIAESVNERLLELGLSQDIIDANCQIYGGELEKWVDVKEMRDSDREALIQEIGGHIHLQVLTRRGLFRTYAEAVQGVDFIDLGIPDPELLDLVDDLPRLLYLMRRGRPNSALVFADGTSGARRRTFSFRYASSKRKAKELFALDDNAVYGAIGLGSDTVRSWRQEMAKERQYAQDLLDSLLSRRYAEAQNIYGSVIDYVRREGKAEEAAHDEIMARKFKVLSKEYRYVSESLGKVKGGLPLKQLDFGTWVILGGMYVLNGKASADEIGDIRARFESAVSQLGPANTRDKAAIDLIVESFVKPRYEPIAGIQLYREVDTGISGSLKATEEKVGRLQKREARRRETLKALAKTQRKAAFEAARVERAAHLFHIESLYEKAITNLGDDGSDISQESFGRFIAWAQAAFLAVGTQPDSALLESAEITDETYMSLANELAHLAVVSDRDSLEAISIAMELLDIALVIEKTLDAESPEEMTIALARFFDTTLNSHIFDYIPYHYHKQRGDGFERLSREEKLELACRRHRWLYTYARRMMVTRTDLKDAGSAYADNWLGDADRDIMGLGVNVEDKYERFWFSYARLRDAVVLRHEGYPFPEVLTDLDPRVFRCDERANVVIVYPHGNTTVPVALEQGAKLEQEGINLMLCAFPHIKYDEKHGRKVLKVADCFGYISLSQYKAALEASGADPVERAARSLVDERGVLVAVKFKEPIIAHGIFFHFTHPMRPEIGDVGAPLIQPIIWEAATHLKCRLPEMLKGSGVRTADQINWYKQQTAELGEDESRKQIRQALRQFAEKHDRIIAKPEKESGGRMAKILPVRQDSQYMEENIDELADVVYTISRVDNVAIQDVLPSHVRRLYSEDFLEDMVDRFARIGVPVLLDREPQTPLYSYFRQVVALGKQGYEITHHITVISTRGIANVGQGGILYEYRDEIINPRYREDMRREITEAALNSLESQRKYIKEHWQEILEEYMQIHPEFPIEITELGSDLTGFSDADIPYEMGDYMPVFLVDGDDNLVRIFDSATEELLPLFNADGSPTDVEIYDEDGRPIPRVDENGHPIAIPVFNEDGSRIPRFDRDGKPISTLKVFKIEPNPGAGLWRPHNDQLPAERKGEGVFKIFKCLGERAGIYRDRLLRK